MPTTRGSPTACEHEAHLCVLAGQADVHRQGHRDSHPHRRPVDRGDDRLLRLEDPQRHLTAAIPVILQALLSARVEGVSSAPEIRSCTECAPLPRDDHHAHVVVLIDLVECREEFALHLDGKGVETIRPEEREREYVVVELGTQGFESHRVLRRSWQGMILCSEEVSR